MESGQPAGRPPLSVRVDLHNHTHHSGDGELAPLDLLEAAAAAGIHCLAVTDHDTIEGALECLALAEGDPALPRVVPGMEISTAGGEIIGLYLEQPVPPGLDPEETAQRIRALGGLVYLPHPYDSLRRSAIRPAYREAAARAADIIEVRNGRTLRSAFDRESLALAARLGKAMGAGSDAHYAAEVGRCYVLTAAVPGRDSLLELLRRGRPPAGPTARDRLRAWRNQIRTGARKLRRRVYVA